MKFPEQNSHLNSLVWFTSCAKNCSQLTMQPVTLPFKNESGFIGFSSQRQLLIILENYILIYCYTSVGFSVSIVCTFAEALLITAHFLLLMLLLLLLLLLFSVFVVFVVVVFSVIVVVAVVVVVVCCCFHCCCLLLLIQPALHSFFLRCCWYFQ